MLEKIRSPEDLKSLGLDALSLIAGELRGRIIEQVAQYGGHLSSNLGVVELTLALHYVFQTPQDVLVWDVGHQTYAHKLLTGRQDQFCRLRQDDGLCGFPLRSESIYDAVNTGHASTSLSQALGLRAARDIHGEDHKIVAIMGDGAISGGLALEALNNSALLKKDLILVLNDNEHAISPNVGALAKQLSKLRSSSRYRGFKQWMKKLLVRFPYVGQRMIRWIDRFKFGLKAWLLPNVLFESFGFSYLGPIDGHDLKSLISVLQQAKGFSTPVLVHVLTQKGRGYPPAETDPTLFHSAPPFDITSGIPRRDLHSTFTDVVRGTLAELGEQNPKIVCITAAMADGTGLATFASRFPRRFFDVGIAESHALSFAAGLALGGLRPVVAIYSTFLQRGFDQILHDICLQNLPVLILVDRAGVVPGDGSTHQGIFDLSFLRIMPGLSILAPASGEELRNMIFTALGQTGPVAIRYPKSTIPEAYLPTGEFHSIPWGKGRKVMEGKGIAFLALGGMVPLVRQAAMELRKDGRDPAIYDLRFLCPLDRELILSTYHQYSLLFIAEENTCRGGLGSAVLELINHEGYPADKIRLLAISDLPGIGSREHLLQRSGLSPSQIASQAREALRELEVSGRIR
ncbi:MAG: 1-deoxy-D-xylulose-5-phosphate synthase [bacterium]